MNSNKNRRKTFLLPSADRSGLAAQVQELRVPVAASEGAQISMLKHQLAQVRRELALAREKIQDTHAAAVERAHREDRLRQVLLWEVDNTQQWRAKMAQRSGPGRHQVRVIVTSNSIAIRDL